MAGHKWTSEENITALLLVQDVTRQQLATIFEFLHRNEKRRYFFNDRTEEAINSRVSRLIKDLKIDGNNNNLSPAKTAFKLKQEWKKKKEKLRIVDFIDSILEEIKSEFRDLEWIEIDRHVADIKESLKGSGQASGEHSD